MNDGLEAGRSEHLKHEILLFGNESREHNFNAQVEVRHLSKINIKSAKNNLVLNKRIGVSFDGGASLLFVYK